MINGLKNQCPIHVAKNDRANKIVMEDGEEQRLSELNKDIIYASITAMCMRTVSIKDKRNRNTWLTEEV